MKYFFSYSRDDSEFVLKLAKDLRAQGVEVWLDQLDIVGGQRWDSAIERALETCQAMLVVLTPMSLASHNVMDEVSYALEEHKLVVPIVVRACTVPFRLRRVQRVDFTGVYETAFVQLLRALGIQPALGDATSDEMREGIGPKKPEVQQTLREEERLRAAENARKNAEHKARDEAKRTEKARQEQAREAEHMAHVEAQTIRVATAQRRDSANERVAVQPPEAAKRDAAPRIDAAETSVTKSTAPPMSQPRSRRLITIGIGAFIATAAIVSWYATRTTTHTASNAGQQSQSSAVTGVKGEAVRLQAEAKSIMKLVDFQKRELRDLVTNSTREVERLESQVRSARSEGERATMQIALLEAKSSAEFNLAIERGARNGYDRLPSIESTFRAAETALNAGNTSEAKAKYSAVVDAMSKLRAVPDEERKQLQDARNKTLSNLAGRWGLGNCNAPSVWTVKDSTIQVYWPSAGVYEARVVGADGTTVTVAVTTSGSQQGHIYKYRPVGTRLDIEEVNNGRRAALSKCS